MKEHKKHNVMLILGEDEHAKLRLVAAHRKMSMSLLVRTVMEEYLNEYEVKDEKKSKA